MELDTVLQKLGHCGRFQILNYALLSLPLIFSAMPVVVYIFTAADIDHRCLIPECETLSNYTFDAVYLNFTTPLDSNNKYDEESRFKPIEHASCDSSSFSKKEKQPCDEWVWLPPEYTIANEWNITGNTHRWMLSLVGTINNIGQLVGYMIVGFVSDRFGRKKIFLLGCMGSCLFGMIRSFSPSYNWYLVFIFFEMILQTGIYLNAFILGMELVGGKMRALGGATIGVFYAIGEALVGIIASQIFYWRTLLRVIYGPPIIFFALYWIVPESIIWLTSQGKDEEAIKILRRAARINNVELTNEDIKSITHSQSKSNENENTILKQSEALKKLMKSKILLKRILYCSFGWLTNTMVYYGLSLNSVDLPGDRYLSYVLVCLIELPGYVITFLGSNYFGRRILTTSGFILAGIGCISSSFVPSHLTSLALFLFLVGKCAITVSFTVIYIYTAELFPTPMRNTCVAFCSMLGRIGSIIAPQTPLLDLVWDHAPLILFGILTFVAAYLTLLLPETSTSRLPDTIEEAENIGKNRNL